MATLCDKKYIDKIERVITRAKCNALGLNEHFPRAIIYGPTQYGGMAIPTSLSKTSTTRLNYFLYHIRETSNVGTKLEASIIYLQLEIGLFTSLFSSSFSTYGFLATKTLVKQIWSETEPYGLQLRHHEAQSWLPNPQGKDDRPLMSIACIHYNKREVSRINRYRLYLRVISVYDVLTYDGKQVHPELARGRQVASRTSTIHWVDFPKPPKKDMTLWTSFIETYITPIIDGNPIQWDLNTTPTYRTSFLKSTLDGCLYQHQSDGFSLHHIKTTRQRQQYPTYHLTSESVTLTAEVLASLVPVEVTHRSNDIQVLCQSGINLHNNLDHTSTSTDLRSLHSRLPKSLQRLCGEVHIPEDGGSKLLQHISTHNKPCHLPEGKSRARQPWQSWQNFFFTLSKHPPQR